MTPKEYAKDLYNKYYGIPLYVKTVKQCCIITVDRILDTLKEVVHAPRTREYFQEVKQEIEKL